MTSTNKIVAGFLVCSFNVSRKPTLPLSLLLFELSWQLGHQEDDRYSSVVNLHGGKREEPFIERERERERRDFAHHNNHNGDDDAAASDDDDHHTATTDRLC